MEIALLSSTAMSQLSTLSQKCYLGIAIGIARVRKGKQVPEKKYTGSFQTSAISKFSKVYYGFGHNYLSMDKHAGQMQTHRCKKVEE